MRVDVTDSFFFFFFQAEDGIRDEQMGNRESFCFLAAAVPRQSHQREQGYWKRPTAHQQSAQYRFEDGSQHLAAEQNLSRSAIPSIANQARGSHRDQGHGGQAGPFDLPHAALRDEIRGPRSGLLRASTPAFTDQAAQMESRQAGIPNRRSPGRLSSRSFWGVVSHPWPAPKLIQTNYPIRQFMPP